MPDALYNCVCSFQSGVKLNDDTRLADIVPEMDAEVLRTLQPEAKLRQMVQQMSWVYKVDQQKAPLRIKQRVFQMGEYISGVPADFWLSYLGNPLMPLRRSFSSTSATSTSGSRRMAAPWVWKPPA